MLHVSGAVIAAMILLLLICFVLPIAMYYVFFRFADANVKTLGIGALAFFVGGWVLEVIVLNIINIFADVTLSVPAYLIYTLLISPVMFLLVNFLIIKFIGKGMNTTGDALMYSTGYTGLQNILSIGLTACSNLIAMLNMNSSTGYVVVSDSDYVSYSDVVSASNLISQSGYEYLVNLSKATFSQVLSMCIDRLWLIAAYSAIVMVIWLAVRKKGSLPLLAVAFGMRLIITIPTIFSNLEIVTNVWINVVIAAVLTAVLWVIAVMCWKKFINREIVE